MLRGLCAVSYTHLSIKDSSLNVLSKFRGFVFIGHHAAIGHAVAVSYTHLLLLGTLVVGLDVADFRPLVLGKAENGVLCFHRRSPRFTHKMCIRDRYG